MNIPLSKLCSYRITKVASETINPLYYVSTENMLPNKSGIRKPSSVPAKGKITAFYPGDVLVSNIRPYFKKIWLSNTYGGCSNDVLVFSPQKDCDPEYLYWVLSNDEFFNYAMATSKGTKMPRGDKDALMNYSTPNMTLSEQRFIVHVLQPIQNKIKINAQINDYLDEMLDALWSGACADSHKQSLSELVIVLSGGTPKTNTPEYWEEGTIPFFSPKDIEKPYTLTTEKYITKIGLDNCNSALYPVDTVFLTARGTVGKVCLAGIPMAMNQSCFAFTGIGVEQSAVYQIVKSVVGSLKAKANGATFAAINSRDLKTEVVSIPSKEALEKYQNVARNIHASMLNNARENCHLAKLRDALLPRLISGEIDASQIDLTQLNNHL